METRPESRQEAIAAILKRFPEFAAVIAATVPSDEVRNPAYKCRDCNDGWMHSIGRHKLPDGRVGLGQTVICDSCGKTLNTRYTTKALAVDQFIGF